MAEDVEPLRSLYAYAVDFGTTGAYTFPMLKAGFLGLLSDWVSEQTAKDEAVMEKAALAFRLEKLLAQTDEPEKMLGLFSEWLVFDHKQAIFGGKTGLLCFTERNPFNLPEAELSAYKELLSFEVGLFAVTSIERGKGVALASLASGAERFVHDVNASLSLRGNETVWGRIAPVGGLYHGVGCLLFALPVRVKEGMQKVIAGWKPNSFDAKGAALLAVSPKEDAPAPPSYEESKQRFEHSLKKCGMDGFFSLEAFANWVSDEKKHDLDFAPQALELLTPDDASFRDTAELIRVAAEFTNNIPRQSLGGKTPNEAVRERKSRGEEGDWETDMFSKKRYIDELEQAHEYMAQGEFEKSYKAFEQVVKDLLKVKLPFFHVFRIYANAAVCCFHKGDSLLGETLLDASLRLNPLYDFAVRQKERYVTPLDPTRTDIFGTLGKKEQKMIRDMQDDMSATGKRMYQHRVFSKYEKLLKELGVSLAYRARVTTTVFSFDEDGNPTTAPKIGRNAPCPCRSGKKFKKCCGA